MSERLEARRWAGLDLLRLLVTGLVFLQHALAITGHHSLAEIGGLRVGRIGTTTFFVIGGYLAAVSTRTPQAWLRQRLWTLLPPYWIVLAVSFLAAWLTDYKPFDAWQMFCQFAGIGHFTHHDRLVNVTTWFVSAILVMYLVAYLAKRTSELAVIAAALSASLAAGIWSSDPRVSSIWYAAMFLVAYTLPHAGISVVTAALSWSITLASAAIVFPELRYGAAAMLLFAAASIWRQPWQVAARLSDYSYEWYLVHVLALHLGVRLVGHSFWLVLPVASLVSLASVIALKRLVGQINQKVSCLIVIHRS